MHTPLKEVYFERWARAGVTRADSIRAGL